MTECHSKDECLLSALAHAAIILGAIGPVVGLIIYLMQKEKSIYAAGQALQAAVYQLLGMLVTVIVWSCWSFFYALTFIPLITNPEQYQTAPPPIFWVGMGSMVLPFIVMGIWGIYGLFGALRAWKGADFRYAIIGNLVMNKMIEWSIYDEL